ncbi:Ecm21p KNAG_0C04350 [Huiozyma naganishii CBS 8797]|uniref:Arrestin C-terminal-like domain-containing protein n=1 Tax=Huiozyma naganishii (strain ATCC MYA-139 / BCRC 22969 / CBS 8797 / KCTC 17520 / NBRC 10181 / NCYC 3082 / Yp74L-3) TaxID=1071383 RepID=J7RWY6_HUIN7|nr:hypothetical protein KNAG_0C04350 [Kazachstania naganishii CBS 8797]CCK69537.1 hypothetical protein KNAG_0C04350 [Kazachstania naganishii CBS 8797]
MFERRRSSTIKSALSSLLGSNGQPQPQSARRHSTTSVPRDTGKLNGSNAGRGVASGKKTRHPPRHATEQSAGRSPVSGRAVTPEYVSDIESLSDEDLDDNEEAIMSDGVSEDLNTQPVTRQRVTPPNNRAFLREFLTSRGFLPPRTVADRRDHVRPVKIAIATTGNYVFLPTMSSNDDEYMMRLNGLGDEGDEEADFVLEDVSAGRAARQPALGENQDAAAVYPTGSQHQRRRPGTTDTGTGDDTSASSAPDVEMDGSMAAYNVAVIVSLATPTKLSAIHVQLHSRVKVFWNGGVPPGKNLDEEFYNGSALKWSLNRSNCNLYIPSNISDKEQIVENNNVMTPMQVLKSATSTEVPYLDKKTTRHEFFKNIQETGKVTATNVFQPGDYVFILPIVFSNHLPESLYYPSARVSYRLKVGTRILDDVVDGANHSVQRNNINAAGAAISQSASTVSLASGGSTVSLRDTELEQVGYRKSRRSSILKKMKHTLHIASPDKTANTSTTSQVFGEYPIRVVRTPPQISISTANKPIYINRVWADSLSYEISFAQKYVSLGSEVPIKIKLAPLEKNLCIKRVRVSINEKITFVSKDLKYEYDQVDPVAKDPYNPYYLDFQSKRRKERNLPLLEIRTKDKGCRALREEIVENSSGNNLISYSTFQDSGQDTPKKEDEKDVIGITEPLNIETVLKFPRFENLDRKQARIIPPYGIDSFLMVPNPENLPPKGASNSHKPSVIGFLSGHHGTTKDTERQEKVYDKRFHVTKLRTNSGVDVKYHTKLNEPKRGLYLDSLHFSNIHARHKLEIMLRISKPDPDDPARLRHYEVLIDTPIFLVSEICNSGNMELPTYRMATTDIEGRPVDVSNVLPPPTFEEAISVPNSPLMSPIGSPAFPSVYDPDTLSIQQLNLSRATSISGPSGEGAQLLPSGTGTGGAASTNFDTPMMGTVGNPTNRNHPESEGRFNNLDNVLSSSGSPIFKKDFTMSSPNSTPAKPTHQPPNYNEVIKRDSNQ